MIVRYRKCFNLGNYQNEVIELESDEVPGSCIKKEFEKLKEAVEDMHILSRDLDAVLWERRQRKFREEHPCWDCSRSSECASPDKGVRECSEYTTDLPF